MHECTDASNLQKVVSLGTGKTTNTHDAFEGAISFYLHQHCANEALVSIKSVFLTSCHHCADPLGQTLFIHKLHTLTQNRMLAIMLVCMNCNIVGKFL